MNQRDTPMVNVHQNASVDSPILGSFGEGVTIVSTGESGDWVSIDYMNPENQQISGWVLRRFGDQVIPLIRIPHGIV